MMTQYWEEMMYRIEGDGSWQHTKVWRDGELVNYKSCFFMVSGKGCQANVDGVRGSIDYMVISGIYLIISQGNFSNTRVIFADEQLRGVQALTGSIRESKHPMLLIKTVMLPNLVEFND